MRNAQSERDLAIQRSEAANNLASQHGLALASTRGEFEALSKAHKAIQQADTLKASTIANLEAELHELKSNLTSRNITISKLNEEIKGLHTQAENEREKFEEALDQAMQVGDDLEAKRRALSGKLKRVKTGMTREKQGHEIEVQQMISEMEARFEVTEAELRKVILAKSIDLEKALHQLREIQAVQDSAAESLAAAAGGDAALIVQQLQAEVSTLRKALAEYKEKDSVTTTTGSGEVETLQAEVLALRGRVTQFENDKAELLGALVEARVRVRESFAEISCQ